MSEVRGGVQVIVKEHRLAATFVHCAAHCLNFIPVNLFEVLPIGHIFALISRIIILLCSSTKRFVAFCENIRKLQLEASKAAIPKMSDTRRLERHDAVLNFVQLKPSTEATLEEISNWPVERCSSDCCTYLASLMQSEFLIALMTMKHLLGATKATSIALQGLSLELPQSKDHIRNLPKCFQPWRDDASSGR